MIKHFRDLEVWRRADELAQKVFALSEVFPRSHLFDLTAQLRKAALSVPANLAEGCSTTHTKELLQFINVARRSATETQYLLLFAARRELVTAETYHQLVEGYEVLHRMLNALVASLRQSRATPRFDLARAVAGLLVFLVFWAVLHAQLPRLTGPLGHWSLGHLAWADVPHLVRYQGQAADENEVPLEGPYDLTFRLYDAETTGTVLWQETQPAIPITKGHFSVLLGSVTPLDGMPWTSPCWLAIQINAEPELTPRQRITSVPLAITAERLAVPVTTSTITDDAHSLVPSGVLVLSPGGACPEGYTRFAALDGKFLVADTTYQPAAGGSHTKDLSHAHGAGSYAGPSHTHTFTTGGESQRPGDPTSPYAGGAGENRHTHTGATDSGGTGAITGTSATGGSSSLDIRPAFATVLLCQKD